jgi:integrase/recombinase XerD
MKYDRDALLAIRDSYVDDTRLFIRFLEARNLDMSVDALREYLDYLKEKGYAVETIAKRIKGAKNRLWRVLLTNAETMTVIDRFRFKEEIDEIKPGKRTSIEVPLDEVPTRDERAALLASDAVSERVKWFVKLLSTSGLRVSELAGIRLADCRRGQGFYAVRISGKGDRERTVYWRPAEFEGARAFFNGETYLLETRGGRKYDRREISDPIRNSCLGVLGKSYGAHSWRHYYATEKLLSGSSLKAVSQYIGHASTSLTGDVYIHDRLGPDDIETFEDQEQG